MPLNIPFTLPAVDVLREENIFVMDSERASTQEIRPLKIVILNLMPVKITTETDLIRLLSNSPLQIEIDLIICEDISKTFGDILHFDCIHLINPHKKVKARHKKDSRMMWRFLCPALRLQKIIN